MGELRVLASVVGAWFVAGCSGDEDGDGNDDTDEPSDTDDTDPPDDTDDTDDTDEPGQPTMTATVTPDNGVAPYTVDFSNIIGGWTPGQWAFAGNGGVLTDGIAFALAGAPGEGAYTIGTDQDPNSVVFTDLTVFGSYGVFASTSGTLDVTRWEPTTQPVPGYDAYAMDATFDVTLVNGLDAPNDISVQVVGEVSHAVLYEPGPE
jgi:hypothetical protein